VRLTRLKRSPSKCVGSARPAAARSPCRRSSVRCSSCKRTDRPAGVGCARRRRKCPPTVSSVSSRRGSVRWLRRGHAPRADLEHSVTSRSARLVRCPWIRRREHRARPLIRRQSSGHDCRGSTSACTLSSRRSCLAGPIPRSCGRIADIPGPSATGRERFRPGGCGRAVGMRRLGTRPNSIGLSTVER
jgi:hypothetical protein